MTKAMAKEFGGIDRRRVTTTVTLPCLGRGICVNAVCPGFIESDMTKDLDKEAYLANIPLKR